MARRRRMERTKSYEIGKTLTVHYGTNFWVNAFNQCDKWDFYLL